MAMSAIAFRVSRKSGEYIKPTIASSHSKQAHFGALDAVVIAFFLACAGGLIYLLLQM